MKNRQDIDGFTIIEALISILVLVVVMTVGFGLFASVSSREKMTSDAIVTENLEKARALLAAAVTADKTIPDTVVTEEGVSYARKNNQAAELCATFQMYRGGEADQGFNIISLFMSYFMVKNETHQVYRDDVDFAKHSAGRNCYVISYAPINTAYEKGPGGVCDTKRGLSGGRFTGQTIKGFTVGGPFTTTPGTADGRAVLAQDADAFDVTCKKIPLSALQVGDEVELYVDLGPMDGNKPVYFVKAIKKTQ